MVEAGFLFLLLFLFLYVAHILLVPGKLVQNVAGVLLRYEVAFEVFQPVIHHIDYGTRLARSHLAVHRILFCLIHDVVADEKARKLLHVLLALLFYTEVAAAALPPSRQISVE